jgi:hypothetical protein
VITASEWRTGCVMGPPQGPPDRRPSRQTREFGPGDMLWTRDDAPVGLDRNRHQADGLYVPYLSGWRPMVGRPRQRCPNSSTVQGGAEKSELSRPADARQADRAADELVDEVVSLYVNSGLSTYRIGEKLGIDRQRVTRILHRAGIAVAPRGKSRPRPLRVEDDGAETELRRLYLDERLGTPAIGEMLGIPERRVRDRLARYGIDRRHRGGWDRTDRTSVEPDSIENLYVKKEPPAEQVGNELGVNRRIVLRAAHSYGLPVREGGTPAPDRGIRLIEALYGDPEVISVLREHHVPLVRRPGQLWQRFPNPIPLNAELVADLYTKCGLSSFQIELVTGHPSMTILHWLEHAGIDRRRRGGRSPFLRRWRDGESSRPDRSPRRQRPQA